MQEENYILEMKNISKSFPGVKALDRVNLNVKKGEVLALLGENGAGKSTLLKILSGAYQKDEGQIIMNGRQMHIKTPNDACEAGISIIYQELNYIPDLSISENIFLGNLCYNKLHLVDWNKMNKEAGRILASVGLELDVTRPIGELSVMEKQLVEAAKALSKDMKILVMDEPTSSLNENEVKSLVGIVRKIAKKGIGVIFISHRLEELYMAADRVTILRDGQYIGTRKMEETSKDELIQMMVGRQMTDLFVKKEERKCDVHPAESIVQTHAGKVVFEAKKMCTAQVKDISLKVRRGEILGIYGLMGAGREEMAESFFGLHKIQSGSLYLDGQEIKVQCPIDAIKRGIAYVPAERKSDALLLIQTVRENITAASLQEVSKFGIIRKEREKKMTAKWIHEFGIRTADHETVIENLSGGNQQKAVLARWMERKPRLLILNDPTRGVDVGAKSEIYRIINKLCQEGTAILMISSDMTELLSMSDRVIAMAGGAIKGELKTGEITQEKLMSLVVGGKS